jgi:hypothetical protein
MSINWAHGEVSENTEIMGDSDERCDWICGTRLGRFSKRGNCNFHPKKSRRQHKESPAAEWVEDGVDGRKGFI